MCQHRNKKQNNVDKKANRQLQFIHNDLSGPIKLISINDSKHAITFVEDYSWHIIVYFFNDKESVTEKMADLALCGLVKRQRTDGGTEFTN